MKYLLIKWTLVILVLTSTNILFGQKKSLKNIDQSSKKKSDHWSPELTTTGLKYWQEKTANIPKTNESQKIHLLKQCDISNIAAQKKLLNLKAKNKQFNIHQSKTDGSIIFIGGDQLMNINKNVQKAHEKELSNFAIQFISKHRDLFKLTHSDASFVLKEINRDQNGLPHLKLQQYFQDIPIYSQEIIAHFKANHLTAINGRYLPIDKKIKYQALKTISKEQSIEIAKSEIAKSSSISNFSNQNINTLKIQPAKSKLMWFDFAETLRLVWQVDYLANIHERYLVFIDTEQGTILHKQNLVCGMAGLGHVHDNCAHTSKPLPGPLSANEQDLNGDTRQINVYEEQGTYFLIDATKSMYDGVNTQIPQDPRGAIATLDQRNTVDGDLFFVANGSNNWSGMPTEVSAHYNAGAAYDYFQNTFNRNSIDGNGSSMFSVINVPGPGGESMDNASWNGYFISYGNGQEFRPLAAALDVAAHEMSHGVIQNTANLVYEFQPGALNESFADIFGAMVDREDWNMGEDIVPNSLVPSGTLRNLANPNNGGTRGDFYWQPAHMNEYVNLNRNQDNGGVHINSGIPNKAFFNFASSVGKSKAEQVYYHALSNYLTQNSQFVDCRIAVIQSALDLYDQSTANAAAAAFDAVGIVGDGVPPTSEDRDELPTGQGIEHMLVHDIDGDDVDGTLFDYNSSTNQFLQVSPSIALPKADHVEDGSLAIYVGSDENIYISDLSAANPMSTAQALTSNGGWRKAIVSPDGRLIGALTTDYDNILYVFDPNGQPKQFELFNPSTSSDISSTDSPEYGDAIEFNHNGEYILYDSYNIVSNVFSTNEISYWDIGLIEVWNNTQDAFADGDIFKVFPPQSTNISLGNPSFANNTNDVITLDFLDSDDGNIFVLAADLVNGDVNAVAQTSGFAGYPSYSPSDNAIAFTDFIDDEDQIKTVALSQDKISPSGDPVTYITGGRWPVWYVQGSRSFEQPVAGFDANITVGEGPLTINFVDQSANSPSSWSWTFEGGTPSSSDQENPIVTFENEGMYNVILTVTNPAGSDTEVKNDYIDVTTSVGIEEIGLDQLTIYPNPAEDFIHVSGISNQAKEDLTIVLADQNGKVIHKKYTDHQSFNISLNVSALPAGNYQVILQQGKNWHREQVVVK